jgi:hypothetical protein
MQEYTHKGLFGLCPVYLRDLEGDAIDCIPRHKCLAWLFGLSSALQVWAMRATGNDSWFCIVTGELKRPVAR